MPPAWAADPLSVAAEDVAELADHGLSDAEIFDIAATVAGRAFLTRLMDGLGVEADAGYAAMDPQLRELLMVGRNLSPVPSRHCPEA